MDRNLQDTFLTIVRLGIGHFAANPTKAFDWSALQALAERQGLAAIMVDGINRLPDAQRPPKEELLQLIGQIVLCYDYRYESYRRAIAELAGFYREHGLKMMLLKGYACSIDWPKPEHRPCGDIDIWLFGKQKEADALISSKKGIKIDKSHHHHTVFHWGDFTVENHYDFVNVHTHRSSFELEKIFKGLGADDSHFVEIKDTSTGLGTKVYLPSQNLHALFLIRHMVSHFAAAEITLRHVLDWGFFVENHTQEVDWIWLQNILDKYHMKEIFNLFNAICVDNLGFRAELFPSVQFLPELKEKVLMDILEPKYTSAEPAKMIPCLIYKLRRWNGNSWKQNLCYGESRWENFWMGLYAHLLKPTRK